MSRLLPLVLLLSAATAAAQNRPPAADDLLALKDVDSPQISPDGRTAYLTGGYTLTGGGWDGITVIDLETRAMHEIAVPGLPLDVVVVRE